MKIIREFERQQTKYFQKRHQNNSRWEKQRKQVIYKFLEHCHEKGVQRIADIKKKHFDDFIRELSKDNSMSTIRRKKGVLAEFFQRAKLNIEVNSNSQRRKNKIEHKLRGFLSGFDLTEDVQKKITDFVLETI